MKVLVCGGRNYGLGDCRNIETSVFVEALNYLKPQLIINGGATGADKMATAYARTKRIPYRIYKADWKKYGRSAGPRRNKAMLKNETIDLVLAFPGGKGTTDMINKAKDAGITVIDFTEYFDEHYKDLSEEYHK